MTESCIYKSVSVRPTWRVRAHIIESVYTGAHILLRNVCTPMTESCIYRSLSVWPTWRVGTHRIESCIEVQIYYWVMCIHIWLSHVYTGASASDPHGELAHIRLSHVYTGAHILLNDSYAHIYTHIHTYTHIQTHIWLSDSYTHIYTHIHTYDWVMYLQERQGWPVRRVGTHIWLGYVVATISRLLKIIGLFCRISSLL